MHHRLPHDHTTVKGGSEIGVWLVKNRVHRRTLQQSGRQSLPTFDICMGVSRLCPKRNCFLQQRWGNSGGDSSAVKNEGSSGWRGEYRSTKTCACSECGEKIVVFRCQIEIQRSCVATWWSWLTGSPNSSLVASRKILSNGIGSFKVSLLLWNTSPFNLGRVPSSLWESSCFQARRFAKLHGQPKPTEFIFQAIPDLFDWILSNSSAIVQFWL